MIFEMSDGSETPVSICSHCSDEDWFNPERLQALKEQMDDAMVLSTKGQMYTLAEDGTWQIKASAPAMPPEAAEKLLAWYTSLSLVKPLRIGRFMEPEQMRIIS